MAGEPEVAGYSCAFLASQVLSHCPQRGSRADQRVSRQPSTSGTSVGMGQGQLGSQSVDQCLDQGDPWPGMGTAVRHS